MSLKRRLVLGLLVLVGLGLLVSDVGTYAAFSSYLNGRVNGQLTKSRQVAYKYVSAVGPPYDSAQVQSEVADSLGKGAAIVIRTPQGVPLWHLPSVTGGVPDPAPYVPARLPVGSSTPGHRPAFFETAAEGKPSVQYRALASPLLDGYSMVVAVSLQPVSQTLSRLILVEVVASLSALLALALLAAWLVRVGLRPLDDMARTAMTISEGDLSQGVGSSDPRTEVGRLGHSLNVMLSRLDSAFARSKESEDRLRRFVADASHELRTPLTSIRGYAELFRRGAASDPAAVERAMTRIEGEASRMSLLVEDLLLLARMDQGRPLQRERVELSALAREAAEDALVVDPSRPIDVQAPERVVVLGDDRRMRQVAANLLSNALEHTDDGTAVHLRVCRAGHRGVLEVSDEGGGLDPDQAARVFERFYRVDPSRSRGGSGLGLSIVAAIAEAQGGCASVSTAPGKGATFRVEVPLANGAGGPSALNGSSAAESDNGCAADDPAGAGPPGVDTSAAGRPGTGQQGVDTSGPQRQL